MTSFGTVPIPENVRVDPLLRRRGQIFDQEREHLPSARLTVTYANRSYLLDTPTGDEFAHQNPVVWAPKWDRAVICRAYGL